MYPRGHDFIVDEPRGREFRYGTMQAAQLIRLGLLSIKPYHQLFTVCVDERTLTTWGYALMRGYTPFGN